MSTFIRCQQVVKAYKAGAHEVVALRGIDFEMEEGEMGAIIGPSGAGKSSLLNLLGGLDRPTAGQLMVGKQNLLELKGRQLATYRLHEVGFVWQQVSRNLFAHRTAQQNIMLPLTLAGAKRRERGRRAKELLDAVGLADKAKHKPVQLSGGQQQRVAIAVALANQPRLLLADEPTGSLDRENGVQVMQLIRELREQLRLTVLMVTHDIELADYADRVLTLRDGALGQDLTKQETPVVEDDGRIRLPETVREQLAKADQISVEVRPEGVLLRPENAEEDQSEKLLQGILPQDAPPPVHRFRLRRQKERQA